MVPPSSLPQNGFTREVSGPALAAQRSRMSVPAVGTCDNVVPNPQNTPSVASEPQPVAQVNLPPVVETPSSPQPVPQSPEISIVESQHKILQIVQSFFMEDIQTLRRRVEMALFRDVCLDIRVLRQDLNSVFECLRPPVTLAEECKPLKEDIRVNTERFCACLETLKATLRMHAAMSVGRNENVS